MDLRVGQRPTVEPQPEPTLLALQHPQRLHRHLFLAGLQQQQQQQQRTAEPMRVKTELPAHALPSSLPAASSTPVSGLHSCFFLGFWPLPQLSMDPPMMPELQGAQQEQELRQLLNKDKSKRSKDGISAAPTWVSMTARGSGKRETGGAQLLGHSACL